MALVNCALRPIWPHCIRFICQRDGFHEPMREALLRNGLPRVQGAQEMKSWSLLLKGLVLSAGLCTTGHKAFSLWSSTEEKEEGEKQKLKHFTSEAGKHSGIKAGLGPSPLRENWCMMDEQRARANHWHVWRKSRPGAELSWKTEAYRRHLPGAQRPVETGHPALWRVPILELTF